MNNWACTIHPWRHPRVGPIASNNENGQEMEANGITHAPELIRKCLTVINYTLPKYKMIIIDSMSIVNVIPMTQIIKTQLFCTSLSADICRYLTDIEPLWFSDIGPTSSLYRSDVGLISLTTSGRHRAHVQTWSRPTFADIGPI